MIRETTFNTPILLITFNRLETTKQVFNKIRDQKPKKLYLASDGPRSDRKNEDIKVEKVRTFLSTNIDWDCEVKTLFQEKNFGCNYGPHNAITWFFEHEEQGIILEDDCLPSTSFFSYCETLLEHYQNDLRIFTVGGYNSLGKTTSNDSYIFTKLPMIWGWATWRDCWNLNLRTITMFEEIYRNPLINEISCDSAVNRIIKENAKLTKDNKADAWDYIWTLTCYINNALSVVPTKNLIENIGFGPDSTHTNSPINKEKTITYEINKILIHPNIILPERTHDKYVYKEVLNWKSLQEKIGDPSHILKVLKNKF